MADSKKKIVGEVRLKDVRLSFAHLFDPQPGKVDEKTGVKGPDRWNASFLIEKNTDKGKAELKKVQAAANEAKTAKWGAPANWPKLKPEKLCLRDGDLENYDGYEDHYYLSAGRNVKTSQGAENPPPVLVDRDPSVALDRKSGKLYSGCYVNAVIRIWAQDDKKYGKRLNASLEAVQFLRHGDPFGARPVDPMEAFQDETTEEDVDDYMEGQEAAEEEEEDLIG